MQLVQFYWGYILPPTKATNAVRCATLLYLKITEVSFIFRDLKNNLIASITNDAFSGMYSLRKLWDYVEIRLYMTFSGTCHIIGSLTCPLGCSCILLTCKHCKRCDINSNEDYSMSSMFKVARRKSHWDYGSGMDYWIQGARVNVCMTNST